MRQMSVSLGLGETFLRNPDGSPSDEVGIESDKYMRLAAAGVNVFVSSGDAGSRPDGTGHVMDGPKQAEYPASDPFVIGVGGTTLVLNAGNGAVKSETGWSSSGGGRSIFFARPAYQTGRGVPDGKDRLVPDISATASPEEGALIIINGAHEQIGGTSWSAPVCAGFCALLNEARLKAGLPALTFANPEFYRLANERRGFRDITKGNNGDFHAGVGYDLVTGVGVPDVRELMSSLRAPR